MNESCNIFSWHLKHSSPQMLPEGLYYPLFCAKQSSLTVLPQTSFCVFWFLSVLINLIKPLKISSINCLLLSRKHYNYSFFKKAFGMY